ncbi:phage integrase N-terminal SAM-like domain-containing protein [Marinicellulosiphila megalodicopiae]|uniref:phage integrase N-terminal SAM-like domain-containing protein n=1 Tax=Marinicellulosiphila megalodicopiae TaxID=2724896 RepID=UPI003BB012E4
MSNSPFLTSINREMVQRGYAKRTIETYLYWIKFFINFNKQQHPSQLQKLPRHPYQFTLNAKLVISI